MTSVPSFAETLKTLRQGAGFPTSYAFYHRAGGRGQFPFTYAYYAKIERGAALPRPEWVPQILKCLRIQKGDPRVRVLVRAYVRGKIGGKAFFEEYVEPML